jgi:hypothetical protein
MTLHRSTLTAVDSSADVRVQRRSHLRKPTWLRRTASFTPSTRLFCLSTGNCPRLPPIAEHLSALEVPGRSLHLCLRLASSCVARRNCAAFIFPGIQLLCLLIGGRSAGQALAFGLRGRAPQALQLFCERLRAAAGAMVVHVYPLARTSDRSRTAQRTDTSMISTHSCCRC